MITLINTLLKRSKLEEDQIIRLRRTSIGLVGGVTLTIICITFYNLQIFRTTGTQLALMIGAFWIVNFGFILTILLGLNKRLPDPSMSVAQMVWAITATMVAVYFSERLRSLLLMLCLLVYMFGGLYGSKKIVTFIVIYGIFSYFLVVFLLKFATASQFDLHLELIVLFVFSIVSICYGLLALEFYKIRTHMKHKTGSLQISLEKSEIESTIDPLTGVYNRRYMQKQLDKERAVKSRENAYFFSVLSLDLDYFKTINDTHGHEIGDKALIKFADIIKHSIRKQDCFGRMGGEEFLIIMPLINLEQAVSAGNRLCKLVADTNFDQVIPNLEITVSIGVVSFEWPETVESLLSRVDKALYAAKNQGRNQVAYS